MLVQPGSDKRRKTWGRREARDRKTGQEKERTGSAPEQNDKVAFEKDILKITAVLVCVCRV